MSERRGPDCERVRENLGRLLDGELPKEERERLLAHIGACLECAAAWETVREIRRTAERERVRATGEERQEILRAAAPELKRLRAARRRRGGSLFPRLRRIAANPRVRIAAVAAALVLIALLVPTRGGRAPESGSMVVWTYAELDRQGRDRPFPLGSFDAGSPFAGERSTR